MGICTTANVGIFHYLRCESMKLSAIGITQREATRLSNAEIKTHLGPTCNHGPTDATRLAGRHTPAHKSIILRMKSFPRISSTVSLQLKLKG